VQAPSPISETYWEDLTVTDDDLEFLYQYLLEAEEPKTPAELAEALIRERIAREQRRIEERWRQSHGMYLPKEHYEVGRVLLFPALGWKQGEVIAVRDGHHPDYGAFSVIRVRLEDGSEREFAADFPEHRLNNPPRPEEDPMLDVNTVLPRYQEAVAQRIEDALRASDDFVYIAGRWFPKALLVELHPGNLNLAEAALFMAEGGPLPTEEILKYLDLPSDVNPKLAAFSLDWALQQDERFDEVGPAGQVMWYLRSMEPEEVREVPMWLRYTPLAYDPEVLPEELRALEAWLGDELSPPPDPKYLPPSDGDDEVELVLIYPHWRAGTLPLSDRVRHLFPTAYEAPRIRFQLVDAATGHGFPAWVVRPHKYIYGLAEWYREKGLFPGSRIWVRRGRRPGEVLVRAQVQRPTRTWLRTVMVDDEGRLHIRPQNVSVGSAYEDLMAFYVPDPTALDPVWERIRKQKIPLEDLLVLVMRELSKLTPQGHVSAKELYAAVNLVRRCPPGPIFALLASRPWFQHVGGEYYHLNTGGR